MSSRQGWAHAWWGEILLGLDFSYFPDEDFYRPIPNQSTTEAFLRACLASDPRLLIGNLEKFFPITRLELTMDLTPYFENWIEPEEWELNHPSQKWFIPVYPGMTAADLQEAIPSIIEQLQLRIGLRTVGARIEALRSDGKTQQAIADLLGLDVKSVQAHLNEVRQADLPLD